jgi:hypothetical protein
MMDRLPVHNERDLLSREEEQNLMCDYSLHAVASRPAKAGEDLVSTCFRGSATLGFASPAEKGVAVCLLPGTELAFERKVRYRGGWFKTYTVNFSVAKFCKIAPEVPCRHHDALAFPDGSTVLVNSLVQGQRAQILQLPVAANELRATTSKELLRPMPEAEKD